MIQSIYKSYQQGKSISLMKFKDNKHLFVKVSMIIIFIKVYWQYGFFLVFLAIRLNR